MPRIVNGRILGNPRNWLRIWLMALLALVGFYLLFQFWNGKTGASE